MKNLVIFMAAVLALGFMGCSNIEDDEYDDSARVCTSASKNNAVDFVEDLGNSVVMPETQGDTYTIIAGQGFETAIGKRTVDYDVAFLILNQPGCSDAHTSVSYINKTKSIVNKWTVSDFHHRCKKLSERSELVTDNGIIDWHGRQVHVFTVAYNELYLRLFDD